MSVVYSFQVYGQISCVLTLGNSGRGPIEKEVATIITLAWES